MHTLCNLFSTFPCWSWTMTLHKYKIKRNWVDGFVFSSFYATDHWFEWKGKNDVEDDEKQNSIESIFWVSRNFIFLLCKIKWISTFSYRSQFQLDGIRRTIRFVHANEVWHISLFFFLYINVYWIDTYPFSISPVWVILVYSCCFPAIERKWWCIWTFTKLTCPYLCCFYICCVLFGDVGSNSKINAYRPKVGSNNDNSVHNIDSICCLWGSTGDLINHSGGIRFVLLALYGFVVGMIRFKIRLDLNFNRTHWIVCCWFILFCFFLFVYQSFTPRFLYLLPSCRNNSNNMWLSQDIIINPRLVRKHIRLRSLYIHKFIFVLSVYYCCFQVSDAKKLELKKWNEQKKTEIK